MSITQKLIREENLLKNSKIKDYIITGKGIIAYIAAIECLAEGNNLSTKLINNIAGLNVADEVLRLFDSSVIYLDKITMPSEDGEETVAFNSPIPENKLEPILRAIITDYGRETAIFSYALIGEGIIHTRME